MESETGGGLVVVLPTDAGPQWQATLELEDDAELGSAGVVEGL